MHEKIFTKSRENQTSKNIVYITYTNVKYTVLGLNEDNG